MRAATAAGLAAQPAAFANPHLAVAVGVVGVANHASHDVDLDGELAHLDGEHADSDSEHVHPDREHAHPDREHPNQGHDQPVTDKVEQRQR